MVAIDMPHGWRKRWKSAQRSRAEWRRVAVSFLESARIGRCVVHPECASAATFGVGPTDIGVECWRARFRSVFADEETEWLIGSKCRVCQRKHSDWRRALRTGAAVSGSWVKWYRREVYDFYDGERIPSFAEYVNHALRPRNGDAHHFCPRSRKPNEAHPTWRARIFEESSE